jgi:cell wall-associated protease
MKRFNPRYFAVFFLVFLGSCSSIRKIPVPKPIWNAVELPSKKGELTEVQKQTWGHADLAKDTIPGMSIDKAYDFLKEKKATEIIVAVNDSGIELEHDALKNVLWANEDEIPGNGIDDDKNGYVDDVHGWNFLGDIYDENLEITRLIKQKSPKFEGKTAAEISEADKKEYQEYMKLKEVFDSKLDKASESKNKYTSYYDMYALVHNAMVNNTGKEDYTLEDVMGIVTTDEVLSKQKEMTIRVLNSGTSYQEEMSNLRGGVDYYTSQVDAFYNLDFHPRSTLLGDDEFDMSITNYGDGDPSNREKDEIHGTHVAGIILAEKSTEKGVRGIAKNVKLMSVRCVPNGDEYDKDVALGFRYAVDNGAKVINTSFGKGYSPNVEWVYEAIRYAEKHDVLIVNAAGNNAQNIDEIGVFPNDAPDLTNEISDNMITVGAMSSSYDENLLATFSNYGKRNVDIFAPGVKIYAPVTENAYQFLSGTSMASPSTAGVAAMIRSYYPKLSAKQVKHILMNSGTLIPFKVVQPGTKDTLVSLSELCVTGRIVNAYNAIRMAERMLSKK